MFEDVNFGAAPADYAYSTGANKQYTVASGDTLFKIAQKFYGNGYLYTYLAQINGISNPNLINVGDVLIIPPKPTSSPAATTPAKPSTPVTPTAPLPSTMDWNKVILWGSIAIAVVLIVLTLTQKKKAESPQEA